MSRRRFSERDVIRTLLHQGVTITDFRTGEPITLENVGELEREHLHEIALGGPDEPENCRYSLRKNHSIITNGTKATSAGSSKHRAAKVKRLEADTALHEAVMAGDVEREPSRFPSRPIPAKQDAWPPKGSRPMRRAS